MFEHNARQEAATIFGKHLARTRGGKAKMLLASRWPHAAGKLQANMPRAQPGRRNNVLENALRTLAADKQSCSPRASGTKYVRQPASKHATGKQNCCPSACGLNLQRPAMQHATGIAGCHNKMLKGTRTQV